MRNPLFLSVILCLNFSVFGQGTKKQTVYFETNSHQLLSTERQKLKAFFDLFDKSKITEIQLFGHTDNDGEDEFNEQLSANRSKAVRRFLLVHGLVSSTEKSFGEKKPLNANATDAEKAKNRRVEVVVKYSKGGLNSDRDFKVLAHRNLPTSAYCIDPTRDTFLVLRQGGRVFFPANTFSSDGECVTITSKEAYKKAQMILANLATASNNRLLESGGMIFLQAKNSSGEELTAKNPFEVQLPTDQFKEGMMIFNGEHGHDSTLNWTQNRLNIVNQSEESECLLSKGYYLYDTITSIDSSNSYSNKCEECDFFPCRVKRLGGGIKGVFNKNQRSENKSFRACQKALRNHKKLKVLDDEKQIDTNITVKQTYVDSLVIHPRCVDLKKELDSLGITTYVEYAEYVQRKAKEEFESNLKAGKASVEDVTLYTMRSSRLGWINCDRFIAMPASSKIPIVVAAEDEEEEDLKNAQVNIVLADKTSLIGSQKVGKKFSFLSLPRNMSIFVLAVLMKNGKIFMSLVETKTQKNMPAFKWKEVTFDQLQSELKKLD